METPARPRSAAAAPDLAARARFRRTALALGAFLVVIALAMVLTGWEKAVEALVTLGAMKILALCVLAGGHYVLRALRWHMMVRAGGIPTGAGQNFRHYFGGFAMTATPGRLGELVRLRWLKRETGLGYTRLLPVAFADRAIELGAILLVIVAALGVAGMGAGAAWWVVGVAAAIVWVACTPRLLEAAVVGLWRLTGRRKTRAFARLRRMARDLTPFMRPRVLIPAMALGLVGWGLEGAAFWWLLGWLGADVSLAAATAIFLVAVLSGTLSGLPGGLGGTEAAAVALLLVQGVPADIAILATAIIRVTTLWFAVLIGFFVFPAAEMRATAAMTPKAAL
ncbi:lysylphosphatidylglycerol synthase transmembrane domain-containing protein [Tropicimonas sp. S265A]|uniref:lysylphosphatidylglycerol synthase transmembrane domain-containing protein n=1 Tax=Tropicimonas sp. S265A TaxID=3415134 RepID=UPI003C7D98B6